MDANTIIIENILDNLEQAINDLRGALDTTTDNIISIGNANWCIYILVQFMLKKQFSHIREYTQSRCIAENHMLSHGSYMPNYYENLSPIELRLDTILDNVKELSPALYMSLLNSDYTINF